MTDIFLKIVNMSISAGWIILAVICLRPLLKKAPKWIFVLLWGIVAVRLICPFSIESMLSLMPSAETIAPEIMKDRTPQINTGVPIINSAINPIIGQSFAPNPMTSANPLQILIPIFAIVWIIGIAVLLAYTAISYWRVQRRVQTRILLRENIYQCETAFSPFVLGILRPKIYLPFNISEQEKELVIAHEQAHISRKDHLWKPLGFLLLAIHWFNPLMWIGYVLLCRDIELACDERVVKNFSTEQKADYSQALLSCSVSRRMIVACPIAFGEVDVKNRVKSVLNYKKPAFWIIVIAIVTSLAVAVCFLTNPKTRVDVDDELAVFLDMQIAEHHRSDETTGNFAAISQKILGTEKAGRQTAVYMWVLYQEYSFENGEIRNDGGAHIPTVITAKKTGEHGHYELVEYWEPRDGSYYAEDIKDKFPLRLRNAALDSQRYIDEQKAFCQNSAKEYFSSTSNVGGADKNNAETFESTVSFANWDEAEDLYRGALNADKLVESRFAHLPIYRFDTLPDLEKFKNDFSGILTMDSGYDEAPSFNSVTEKYDEAFFKENSLMLVYISVGNCTHRFKMQNVGWDDNSFTVHIVETTKAESVDTAMSGWFVTVAVEDELIKNCTDFDADLDNEINISLPKHEVDTIPKEPPTLTVTAAKQSINALKGTSSWSYEENGVGESIMADSSHPLAVIKSLPVINVLPSPVSSENPLIVSLQFNALTTDLPLSIPPDKIYVYCWEQEQWNKTYAKSENIEPEIISGNFFFNLKEGNFIYEIVATWESYETFSGTVRYSFCSIMPTLDLDAYPQLDKDSTLKEVYNQTPANLVSDTYDKGEFVIKKTHAQTSEGVWLAGSNSYKYRLEISGKMKNSEKNTTYIVLSNTKEITFEQAWKASGLSSNMEDYFDPAVAVIVGDKVFE